jgi:hypothetical protein
MSADPTAPTTRSKFYERIIGVLIWVLFAAIAVGALYLLSFLTGD